MFLSPWQCKKLFLATPFARNHLSYFLLALELQCMPWVEQDSERKTILIIFTIYERQMWHYWSRPNPVLCLITSYLAYTYIYIIHFYKFFIFINVNQRSLQTAWCFQPYLIYETSFKLTNIFMCFLFDVQ